MISEQQWLEFIEQPLRKLTLLDCEVRTPTVWQESPFQTQLSASFVIDDDLMWDAGRVLKDYLNKIVEAMLKEFNKYDIVEFWPLIIHNDVGDHQFLLNEKQNVPTRVIIQYDDSRRELQVRVEVLFRQVGNYYYPIIGGPIDGFLFPFKHVPYEGQNITFQFNTPFHREYTLQDKRPWPGLDLQMVNRQKSTLINYQFKMPYVYYMGETIS